MKPMKSAFLVCLLVVGISITGCEKSDSGQQAGSSGGSSQSGSASRPSVAQQQPSSAVTAAAAPLKTSEEFKTNESLRYYYVVLDTSGSMQGSIAKAVQAIREFLDQAPKNAVFAFAKFSDEKGAEELVPFGLDNTEQIKAKLQECRANGGTPLGGAIAFSRKKLVEQATRQLGNGVFNLVMVTDGAPYVPGMSDQQALRQMNQEVAEFRKTRVFGQNLNLYTIGWQLAAEHSLKAESAGYFDANDSAGLVKALKAATTPEAVDVDSLLD